VKLRVDLVRIVDERHAELQLGEYSRAKLRQIVRVDDIRPVEPDTRHFPTLEGRHPRVDGRTEQAPR
jgi:hypothetical protein